MFKEIKATYEVVEDTAYIDGDFHKDRSKFIFEVERYLSGASAYGDRSSHKVDIIGAEAMPYYFDTRYEGISTQKEEWTKFWKTWVEMRFGLKVKLSTYEEKEIELED